MDWSQWDSESVVQLWEAVALSLSLDPRGLTADVDAMKESLFRNFKEPPDAHFRQRLRVAAEHVTTGLRNAVVQWPDGGILRMDDTRYLACGGFCDLKPGQLLVKLSEFAAWSLATWSDCPQRFEEIAKDIEQPHWPWGEYSTKLLRHLAAAVKEFWSTFDPEMPETAPKSDEVEGWLVKKCDVPKTAAKQIARIIRADDLPAGPRPSRVDSSEAEF